MLLGMLICCTFALANRFNHFIGQIGVIGRVWLARAYADFFGFTDIAVIWRTNHFGLGSARFTLWVAHFQFRQGKSTAGSVLSKARASSDQQHHGFFA